MSLRGSGRDRRAREDRRRGFNLALRLSTAGLELGVAAGIGLFIGWKLDERFDTAPWLTLTLLLAGIAAGFRNLLRLVKRVSRETFGTPTNDAEPRDQP